MKKNHRDSGGPHQAKLSELARSGGGLVTFLCLSSASEARDTDADSGWEPLGAPYFLRGTAPALTW